MINANPIILESAIEDETPVLLKKKVRQLILCLFPGKILKLLPFIHCFVTKTSCFDSTLILHVLHPIGFEHGFDNFSYMFFF